MNRTEYTYDNAGELLTALTFTSGNVAIPAENYWFGYNTAQSMTARTNNTSVSSYTVNNLNQTTTDGTGYNLSYDNNGNRVGKLQSASFFYTYDDENQLISAATDTTSWPVASRWKTDITYDTQGRMRTRKEYTHNGSGWVLSTETRYIYDGRRVIQERNGSNVPQVTYVRGLDLSGSFERAGGIGGLLSRAAHSGANGATLSHAFYHADANGNITKMIDASQASVADYRYDPFGRTISSSGTLVAANVYQFSSKELMAKSGFYYYGFRFYDPVTQRWPNRDPIHERGGINLYGFVRNSPTRLVDLFGLAFYPSDFVGPLLPGDTRCPDSPPGVSVHDNAGRAKKMGDLNLPAAAGWFHEMVKTGAPWDYKNGPYPNAKQYENFGNFNYGVTGSALGFNSWTLQNEAGIAQQNDPNTRGAGSGTPGSRWDPGSGVWPYGDEMKDNKWIRDGINYNRDYPPGNGPGPCG